jgi:hypothetical protein
MKFTFNAAARAEATKALNHLRSKGSPLTVLAGLFLNSLGDRVAVALGALLVYVVCTGGLVYVKGLEAKAPKSHRTKSLKDDKTDDTS